METQSFPVTCARMLLVTAHPDDEVMFFAPLLLAFAAHPERVFVLCLSTGNDSGLGKTRQVELQKCCQLFSIPRSNVTVVDHPSLQDGMAMHWPVDVVASVVGAHVTGVQPDVVVTFDEYGVSGHINHIATCHGTSLAIANVREPNRRPLALKLNSKSLLRKFCGPLDVLVAACCDERRLLSFDPLTAMRGLAIHASQNALYRQLFVLCSSFTYVISFSELRWDP